MVYLVFWFLPFDSKAAPDPSYLTLDQRISEYSSDPDSCEYQYFKLFKDGAVDSEKETTGMNKPITISKSWKKVVSSQEKLFLRLQKSRSLKDWSAEHLRRSERACFGDDDSKSIGGFLDSNQLRCAVANASESKAEYDSITFEARKVDANGIRSSEGLVYPAPRVIATQGLKNAAPGAQLFVLAHESGHIMDWIHPDMRSCLMSAQSISAHDVQKLPGDREVLEKLKEETLRQRKNRKKSHFEVDKGRGTELYVFARILLKYQPVEKVSGFFEAMRSPSGSDVLPFIRSVREEFKKKNVDPVLERLWSGNSWADSLRPSASEELITIEQTFQALLSGEVSLPEQFTESAADSLATATLAEYLNNSRLTASQKKSAVMSVLRAFPPELYSDAALKVMSSVGSKQPNENRMLRIFLADPNIRDAMGCRPHSKTEPALRACFDTLTKVSIPPKTQPAGTRKKPSGVNAK